MWMDGWMIDCTYGPDSPLRSPGFSRKKPVGPPHKACFWSPSFSTHPPRPRPGECSYPRRRLGSLRHSAAAPASTPWSRGLGSGGPPKQQDRHRGVIGHSNNAAVAWRETGSSISCPERSEYLIPVQVEKVATGFGWRILAAGS